MSEAQFNIVLFEPEIPENTGNIGRTCVGMNSKLHLVGKMGFEINNVRVKRAGLDYWPDLDWVHHANWEIFWETVPNKKRVFFLSSKVEVPFYDVKYQPGDYFVFGPETRGLQADLLKQNETQSVTIPMLGPIRSLNLSNSVAIVLYEAFRQVRV
jgi:tRNA (cytidine/uridine-2'-O-)-methyltransferase